MHCIPNPKERAARMRLLLDDVANRDNIGTMSVASFTLSDSASTHLDEIQTALEGIDGEKPSKSRVVRLALATMRKRMSEEGLLKEPT